VAKVDTNHLSWLGLRLTRPARECYSDCPSRTQGFPNFARARGGRGWPTSAVPVIAAPPRPLVEGSPVNSTVAWRGQIQGAPRQGGDLNRDWSRAGARPKPSRERPNV
jgi:hypothetical protein